MKKTNINILNSSIYKSIYMSDFSLTQELFDSYQT